MGRKLIRRMPDEKRVTGKWMSGHAAMVFCQHALLLSSVYVLASTACLVHTGAITGDVLPSAIVLLFSGCATLISIGLCNATAWCSSKPLGRSFITTPACFGTLSKSSLLFSIASWAIASGLAIAFTSARQPFCLTSARTIRYSPAIDVGTQCMVHRASVAASLLALIFSIALSIAIFKTSTPYLAHLLGVNKHPALLSLTLPYKTCDRPIFSKMSFKCRSTSSFSTYTLVDPSEDALYNLYPTRPERAYGLGIYAPKSSTPSFLTPRPSLKKIRSQTSLGRRPVESSPLPPLPVYNPEKYRKTSTVHKMPPKPGRAYTLRRDDSQGTLRAVPRSPALAVPGKSISNESLSSVYSRSVSGDKHSPSPCRPNVVDRNYSSSSTLTVRHTPLETGASKSRAFKPPGEAWVGNRNRVHGTNAGGNPMHGRIPLARAVSNFGNVQEWVKTK